MQYGAILRPDGWGTADRAFHKQWSHALLVARFTKLNALNQRQIKFAEKHGYVETIPDRTVDPKRGYPLMCTRTDKGRILPTVPLNYHIQGTAMWWTIKAMIAVQAKLDEWRNSTGFDGHIVMQVHDELVLDLPKSEVHPREDGTGLFRKSNLWRIKEIARIMEQGGRDFVVAGRPEGIPTPVGIEYHADNWSEGETL